MEVKNVISKIAALTIIGILLTTAFVIGAISVMITIHNTANVQTIGVSVTWSNNGTDVTSMNWGDVTNNTITQLRDLINITNIGTSPITLSFDVSNISPSNAILDLTWDYNGTVLNQHQFVLVQMSLSITSTVAGSFTFDTAIIGTEA
jgi:hypothetical protein